MRVNFLRRRVLITAPAPESVYLHNMFIGKDFSQWEALLADSCESARFVLQHSPCDVLLLDDSLFAQANEEGLAWLTNQKDTPVVLLGHANPERLTEAFQRGVSLCLPRELTLANPPLLSAALDRVYSLNDLRPSFRRLQEQLGQIRRHNDRLVTLIWRTSPRESDNQWFPQRYVMDRLQEELARCERYNQPLTLAVGEVQASDEGNSPSLTDWMADRLHRGKRRCDVAGQYGLRGFLLLMVHTPPTGGIRCCHRLKHLLEEDVPDGTGPRGPVRAYFGLASSPEAKETSVQNLLRRAEQNLEAARNNDQERIVAE